MESNKILVTGEKAILLTFDSRNLNFYTLQTLIEPAEIPE